MSRVMGQKPITPREISTKTFHSRDQVVHLETAVNLRASRPDVKDRGINNKIRCYRILEVEKHQKKSK